MSSVPGDITNDPGVPMQTTTRPSEEVTLDDLDDAVMFLLVDRGGRSRVWLAEGVNPGKLAKGTRRLARSLEAHARALRSGRL